ncbi:MAG: hypothetical protein L6R41_004840 [Letrouitia leprolyta]|nr:MAG: hypothetical protein L6R41_004840 [Letrouitia leprolyta]
MATPDRNPDNPTFSSLPYEIYHKTLYNLLVESSPIWMNHGDIYQNLRKVNFTRQAYETFYHYNTFNVSEESLQSFLDSTPSATAENNGQTLTPKNYVKHLIVSMYPLTDNWIFEKHNPTSNLRRLYECPRLEKLELPLVARFEGLCEFDFAFVGIAAICAKMMEWLGEENFTVRGRHVYGERRWTLAEFKSGHPPKGWP